ncbi:ATPase [Zymobacter palmae]|uniref:ATPase n=1 Tax=Zymobacter palmae TaxID=33074 RepID=A0A348HEK8_9GAMM|nr:ATPase [Zymobacter palmae]
MTPRHRPDHNNVRVCRSNTLPTDGRPLFSAINHVTNTQRAIDPRGSAFCASNPRIAPQLSAGEPVQYRRCSTILCQLLSSGLLDALLQRCHQGIPSFRNAHDRGQLVNFLIERVDGERCLARTINGTGSDLLLAVSGRQISGHPRLRKLFTPSSAPLRTDIGNELGRDKVGLLCQHCLEGRMTASQYGNMRRLFTQRFWNRIQPDTTGRQALGLSERQHDLGTVLTERDDAQGRPAKAQRLPTVIERYRRIGKRCRCYGQHTACQQHTRKRQAEKRAMSHRKISKEQTEQCPAAIVMANGAPIITIVTMITDLDCFRWHHHMPWCAPPLIWMICEVM